MASIGERIKEARKEKHFTQAELGKLVQESSQVISNIERDYTVPNSEQLKLISKALNKSTEYLLAEKNSEIKGNVKTVDIADDTVIKSFEGKPIPEEDLEVIKRFLRGKE